MSNKVIEVKNLTKVYDDKVALENFNLTVEKGNIYGIIGPNGSGKTTLFRMLAGLSEPTSGSISFFGNSKNLKEERQRMSFMIELPYLDLGMTAKENLMMLRYIRGVSDEKKIGEVLEIVGLKDTGNKIVKKFSLGMKQRLGIAMSLLSDPEVMVLDEPVNGLDPEGMVEIRKLLKKLSEEMGVSILISSHILSELYELSTDYALIKNGKLIETLSADELHNKCRSFITLKTDDINKSAVILEEKLDIKSYKVVSDEEIHIYEEFNRISQISKTVTDNGQVILKLNVEGESLEDYYLEKVGDSHE